MPPYLIRESTRAKHVRLKFTLDDGLVVVVPRGFKRSHVPSIVDREHAWIEKAQLSVETRRREIADMPPQMMPEVVTLRAIGEERDICYRPSVSGRSTARESGDGTILVSGDAGCVQSIDALRRWTARKARRHLVPWLGQVSEEIGLPFGRTSVRSQRTRWASCSANKSISINQKLLFLPALLVEHVFVHELCHTQELNHSRRFWNLLAAHEPDFKRLDGELKKAWRYVPSWMCNPGSGELNQSHYEFTAAR